MEDEKTTHGNSNGRWLPGKSANPAGRGMTNRQRIAERLIADRTNTILDLASRRSFRLIMPKKRKEIRGRDSKMKEAAN